MSIRQERQRTTAGGAALLTALAVTMAGCEPPEPAQGPVAADFTDQTLKSVAEYRREQPWASADLERGRALFASCGACHSLEAAGQHRMGPSLYGIFGRRAGSQSGFNYSASLREAEFRWSPEALDAWLAQPYRFLPGNRMSFVGIADESDRTDLIAYLLSESAKD